MAVRFILMMALIMIGSADPIPDPDQDVHIDVKQIVNAQCGGGCCNNDCCSFEDGQYRSGQNIVAGCAKLCCKPDGEWEFKGIIKDCGECIVAAEPWVKTFNPVKDQHPGNWYRTNKPGSTNPNPVEYVLTQNQRITKTPIFGVNGNFYYATGWPGDHGDGSYFNKITYYEDSGSKTVEWSCFPGDNNNLRRPCTRFELNKVNGIGIWVFTVANPGKCIIIVGNVGLTVMVCMDVKTPITQQGKPVEDIYLPYVYIYASSSLAHSLYGICNTFTGTGITLNDYEGRYSIYNASTCALPKNDWIIEKKCSGFMDFWEAK